MYAPIILIKMRESKYLHELELEMGDHNHHYPQLKLTQWIHY